MRKWCMQAVPANNVYKGKVQFIQAAQAKRRIATLAPGKAAQVQQVTDNRHAVP